ncbi:MAG: D-alanyl-D-alanine carboxypeptidase family protein, partial [Woeseiaceae bacterium]
MLRELHQELGIPLDYGACGAPKACAEATDLVEVGPNLVGSMQHLEPDSARKWQRMVAAAASEGVILLLVSGFRSVDYQARLIRKKINAGQ